MATRIEFDSDGYLTYPNGFRMHETEIGCAFDAHQWHGGQGSALYAFGCGDFSPDTVTGAWAEFQPSFAWMSEHHPEELSEADYRLEDELRAWAEGIAGKAVPAEVRVALAA
jgi:hypothetical protein